MPKEFSRIQRVNNVIQKELAVIISREMDVSGMITISEVNVSPDLKQAKIYISLLGGNLSAEAVVDMLNESTGMLRYHLSQQLTLRTTPKLHFYYDNTIEEGMRLSALIDSVLPQEKTD